MVASNESSLIVVTAGTGIVQLDVGSLLSSGEPRRPDRLAAALVLGESALVRFVARVRKIWKVYFSHNGE